jgi:renalase
MAVPQTVAVIGAGIAGLSCASALTLAGRSVRLFDKGRSPGGRIATRRVETGAGTAQFDHGAQYLTVRDPEFTACLEAFGQDIARPWPAGAGRDWRVAAPGMSALPRALAVGLSITSSTRIIQISGRPGGWTLNSEDGQVFAGYDAVVLATPAEQAAPLLACVAPALAEEAAAAVTAPCWTGLFAFDGSAPVPAPIVEPPPSCALAWLACDSTKPGRPDQLRCWVAQASPEWTRAHLEETPGQAAGRLLKEMTALIGDMPVPLVSQAHRWRYARVERPAGTAFGWDETLQVGVCGDWRLGPRIELAWTSGRALAGAMTS